MIFRNKLVPVALGAALLGGSVGAFVMRPAKTAETQVASAVRTAPAAITPAQNFVPTSATNTPALNANGAAAAAAGDTENECYREGFAEGFRAAREEGVETGAAVAGPTRARSTERVVYRPATRTRYVRSRNAGNSRQVYYDYNNAPRKRSFWQKHRDKLTVAAGAGGGALIGGLIGGKKGALIGGLAGGGGSALYTYKLRKRDRRY